MSRIESLSKENGIALNDHISVPVDDAEEQKKRGAIKEMKMKDPTVNSESKAKDKCKSIVET